MAFEIHYFHDRVYEEVQSWPVDVLADYARLVELLTEHGPSPYAYRIHAPLEMACLNCVRVVELVWVGHFIVFCWGKELSCCMHSLRNHSKLPTAN